MYTNTRLLPAEVYLLDSDNLYVVSVTAKMSEHYAAVAKRIAMVLNAGVIKKKVKRWTGGGQPRETVV